MAEFSPIVISGSGLYETISPSEVVDYRFLGLSGSVITSGTYQTTLPDPFHISTASADVSNPGTATQIQAIRFTVPPIKEKDYYLTRAIIGSRTGTAAQESRIGLTVNAVGDGLSALEHASSLTALQYRYYGTADTLAENTAATTNVGANTNYPDHIYAITTNTSTTANLDNKVVIVAGGGATVVLDQGTSHFENHFFGISSSIAPKDAPTTPLSLTSSIANAPKIAVIGSGHTIDDADLPPTSSTWISQSLGTALSTTSATVYTTIFTLTGLVDGARYVVNLFLAARTAATTTAFDVLISNANNHNGTIWTPETATTYEFLNSADGTELRSEAATTYPAANADRLVRAEYSFTKAVGSNPTIAFKSEVAGSAATVQTYSVVYYKRIDTDTNRRMQAPMTLSSGSITLHTEPGSGNRLGINTNALPVFGNNKWQRRIKRTVTTNTGAASATAINIAELGITFANSRKYLVICYLGCAASATTTGVRVGVSTANLTISYTIEAPTSTTAVSVAHNATPATADSPSANINNFYLYKIYALITTNATNTPTFVPTLAAEANNLTVAMGESLLYYAEI